MLRINRKSLSSSLSLLSSITARTASPWEGAIEATIRTHNLALRSASGGVECVSVLTGTNDNMDSDKTVCVDARGLAQTVRSAKSTDVGLLVADGKLLLDCDGASTVLFETCKPELMPASPVGPAIKTTCDLGREWLDNYKWVLSAVCKDSTRGHIHCVSLNADDGVMVATDGHRMHVAECLTTIQVRIPYAAALAVAKLGKGSITLYGNDEFATLKSAIGSVTFRNHAGERDYCFPAWKQVVRSSADDALRVGLIPTETKAFANCVAKRKVKLAFNGKITCDSSTADSEFHFEPRGQLTWAERVTTQELSIGFEGSYIVDALDIGGPVLLRLAGELDPLVVEYQAGQVAVVMPMRI